MALAQDPKGPFELDASNDQALPLGTECVSAALNNSC